MPDTTFDTLEASRRLKAAGFQAEQADAIVDVMNRSTAQLLTAERFEAGVAPLGARIGSLDDKINSVRSELTTRIDSLDAKIEAVRSELTARIDSLDARIEAVRSELLARIDALRTELRAEFMRAQILFVGIVIAANALMLTILGVLLSRGAI